METSDLLKELRIDREARAPRRHASRVLLVAAVLLALAGAGLWLVLARAAPVTVRVAAARTATEAADGGHRDLAGVQRGGIHSHRSGAPPPGATERRTEGSGARRRRG